MEFKIEYLLVLVIALVVLTDFIIKKIKKKSKPTDSATKSILDLTTRNYKTNKPRNFEYKTSKKTKRFLFTGLVLLFIASVGVSYIILKGETKNSLTKENLKGNVKTLSEYSFAAVDKIDGIKKGQLKRNDGGVDYQKTYNLSGNLIEYLNLKNQTTIKSIYDDKQNIVEEISTDIDSVFLFTNKYKYDSDNNIIEKTQYDSVGTFNSKYTYRHDSNKNIIERNFYNSKKNLEGRLSYKYDTNNKLLENSKYDSVGNLKFKFTYIHDLNGNVIEKNVFDSSEKLKTKFTYEYKLDNNNNWVQCVEFENSLPIYILVRKIEYHLDNQKISNKEEFPLDYFYKGYHSKNSDTARFYFDKAILIDSSFASAYYEREKRWWNEGKGFTKAIEIDPNYIEAYRGRAKIGERGYGLGRKVAYKDYSKIIEINPRDVDAYLSRSELSLYATDNVYESSKFKLNDLNKVLEIDPNNAHAHVSIGMHKQREENYVGAIASFTKAVESDPTHDSAYSFRAESKEGLKDYNGAINDYYSAIYSMTEERKNEMCVGHYYYDIAYIEATKFLDYDEAIRVANKAIKLYDDYWPNEKMEYGDAYLIRAFSKQSKGDYYGACLDMKKAKNISWDLKYKIPFIPCQ